MCRPYICIFAKWCLQYSVCISFPLIIGHVILPVEFPTNRTELNAVFNVFDQDGSGSLDYKEFVDALKPDRQVGLDSRHVQYVQQ